MPVEEQIRKIFGKKDYKIAVAIFKAESHLRCNAEGDGHLKYTKNGIEYGASYGVAQIRHLPGRPTPKQLKDCTFNIKYAKQLKDKQGWNVWSAYKNKSYLKYL